MTDSLSQSYNESMTKLYNNINADDNVPVLPAILASVSLADNSVWKGAIGHSNLENSTAIQKDDQFRAGSITKTFIATLILQLQEQGKLSITDTINNYLPDNIVNNISVINGVNYGNTITIEQLLRHSSGIYEYGDDSFDNLIKSNPAKLWTAEELVQHAIDNGSPYFIPGAEGQYHYSNTGYILLGMIIEEVSNLSLAQVMSDNILIPLQLNNTLLDTGDALQKTSIAEGYYDTQPVSTAINGTIFGAAGALISSTEDLRRFMRALMKGRLFKKSDTLNNMLNFNENNIGLGLRRAALDGTEIILHDGGTFGWKSIMAYHKEQKTSIVFSFNQGLYDNLQVVPGLTLDTLFLYALVNIN